MPDSTLDGRTIDDLIATTDLDFVRELIDAFLQELQDLLETLAHSHQGQDAEGFRRAAHSLKSNSATFGATHLTRLAQEMELLGREKKLNAAAPLLDQARQAFLAVAQALRTI